MVGIQIRILGLMLDDSASSSDDEEVVDGSFGSEDVLVTAEIDDSYGDDEVVATAEVITKK